MLLLPPGGLVAYHPPDKISVCRKQTSVWPFDDGLVEERRDGVDLPQLRHLTAWTEHTSRPHDDSLTSIADSAERAELTHLPRHHTDVNTVRVVPLAH